MRLNPLTPETAQGQRFRGGDGWGDGQLAGAPARLPGPESRDQASQAGPPAERVSIAVRAEAHDDMTGVMASAGTDTRHGTPSRTH